jgi:hypothetical protein
MIEQSENPDEKPPASELEKDEKKEAEVDRITKILEATAVKLGEYCESVRIIVSINHGDGNYQMLSRGDGNFYAQRDSVREWLIYQDQATKNEAG